MRFRLALALCLVTYCSASFGEQNECSDEGFVSLFNGQDLTGWKGAKGTYVVENGVLRSLPEKSGNLETEKQFSDFIFRCEFRLTPGANNGIGLRVPAGQHAATQGMEIQIIDETSERAKSLKPYQVHGSVYGLIPAKKGFLKPVGEWNQQEIRCIGKQVTVILNGEVIVDGDIVEAYQKGPLDDREHPGVERMTGHIGLLGHKSVVEFRNLCIKEIAAESAIEKSR